MRQGISPHQHRQSVISMTSRRKNGTGCRPEKKKESLEEIEGLRKMLKCEPDLRTVIEQDIAHEQRLLAVIDYHVPDEATRRSPFYDPDKPIKKPDLLKRISRGGPTTPPARSGAAAARRRRSREE